MTTTAIMTTIMLLMMMVMISDDGGDEDDDDDDEHDYSAFSNNAVSNGISECIIICFQHFRSRRANVVCKSTRQWLVV